MEKLRVYKGKKLVKIRLEGPRGPDDSLGIRYFIETIVSQESTNFDQRAADIINSTAPKRRSRSFCHEPTVYVRKTAIVNGLALRHRTSAQNKN